MKHFVADDVIGWLLSGEQLPADLDQHVAECDSCSRAFREGQRFVDTVRDPEVWSRDSVPPERESPALNRLVALEERIAVERQEAEDLVRRLSIDDLETRIGAFRVTPGLVMVLIRRSFDEVERDPELGATYAELGVVASHALSMKQFPQNVVCSLRGQAMRQRANANRMQGRLPAALEDLELAETEFLGTTVPEPEIASLDYIRGAIAYERGRLAEAREALERAIPVFRQYADEQRLRNAQLLLSGILERDGERERAIDQTREILRNLPSADVAFRGRVLNQLGDFLISSDPSTAENYLQQARHCFESEGLRTEAFRALWNLGRAARGGNDPELASRILERAYEEAVALGLKTDIALIALDRADLLLEDDEYELIVDLCNEAMRTFHEVGAPRFAAEAFAYLERAARSEQLSFGDLNHVRDFVSEAARHPDASFTPPAN